MLLKHSPEQKDIAIDFYKQIAKECDKKYLNLVVVGHSLGGSLAQIIGTLYGVKTITFNAYGTKNLLPYKIKDYYFKNITNYCNIDDLITRYNAVNHIGKCYAVQNTNNEKAHDIEYMAPLYTRKEVHPSELQKRPQDIVYNNINKVKTYSKELSDHFGRNVIFMPGIHSDDNTCSGSYPVRGYERKDGTKVNGYIRECFKHGTPQTKPAREKYKGMKLNQLNKNQLLELLDDLL